MTLNPKGTTTQCIYCHERPPTLEVPALNDDVGWDILTRHHKPDCEWVLTRGGRIPEPPPLVASAAPADPQVTKRYRINVSRSVKGVETPDITVEHTGPDADMDQALAELDRLTNEVNQRFPKGE